METKDKEITIIDLLQPKVFPEPYVMSKHLGGSHDQKTHGVWASGVGNYDEVYQQVEALRAEEKKRRKETDAYLEANGLYRNAYNYKNNPEVKRLWDRETEIEEKWRSVEKKFYEDHFNAPSDTDEFREYRDEYVVADTPTLSMNRNLRGNRPRMTQRIENADAMCASGSVKKDVGVYRGAILPKEMVDQITVGSTYIDKGFQSTDLSASGAKSYAEARQRDGATGVPTLLRMTLKTGLNAVDVGYGEIVVQRNANMKVTGKSEADGFTIIDVEVTK